MLGIKRITNTLNRIYLSIIITAIISLFLLGKLIDEVFDAQTDFLPEKEFATEIKFLNGVIRGVSDNSEKQLMSYLIKINLQFDVQIALEKKASFSLNDDLSRLAKSESGLLIESKEGTQLIRELPSSEYLLVYNLPNNAKYLRQQEEQIQLEFWLTILFYIGFVLILSGWAFPLAKRLAMLNRFAARFGAGELSVRVKLSKFSYIEELEQSFNRMANQIEELIAENKILAGSISHDLRTPVSCLRFGVDSALDTQEIEKKNSYIKRIDDDLTRLELMLEAFLDYASLERKRLELEITRTNLTHLVLSTINACEALCLANNKEVCFISDNKGASIHIHADPFWMGRALSNLLTNAIDHANKKVNVSVSSMGNIASIIIEDDGAGIPEKELNNIFKAFVKLDKSRSKNSHYGLGLAIVSRVAAWHDSQVQVGRSGQLGGASFRIDIPCIVVNKAEI